MTLNQLKLSYYTRKQFVICWLRSPVYIDIPLKMLNVV